MWFLISAFLIVLLIALDPKKAAKTVLGLIGIVILIIYLQDAGLIR